MFRIGQKVVCVDDGPSWNGDDRLRLNAIYTVAGFDPGSRRGGMYIVETPPRGCIDFRGKSGCLYETPLGWNPSRFRPLIERKTDTGMAILREILDRENEREPKREPDYANRER